MSSLLGIHKMKLKAGCNILGKFLSKPVLSDAFLHKSMHTSTTWNVAGVPIRMPSLSPTMAEGTIVKWLKQEGDSVQPGDVICDIQTDKAVVSMELEEEGILAKILRNEDSKDITVGQVIALMVDTGEDWKAVEIPESVQAELASPSAPAAAAAAPEAQSEFSGVRHLGTIPSTVGPAVRTLLELYDIDAARVSATGPHGNLLKGDVLAYITAHRLTPQPPTPVAAPGVVSGGAPVTPPSATAAAAPRLAPASVAAETGAAYVDLELSSMRKTIAKRLTQSKTEIPHAYVQCTTPIDRLLADRRRLKADGVQASLNDYIVKAVALSLRLHPDVNCTWGGEQGARSPDVDISIAVATEAGLITPIVRTAADRSVADICAVVKDLAARARAGKLQPDEYLGGSFTISNLGMFGVDEFSAIINPPQCGILAVGGGRTLLAEDGSVQTMLTCTLSYDARAIATDSASAFMETLASLLASPELIVKDARRQLLADSL